MSPIFEPGNGRLARGGEEAAEAAGLVPVQNYYKNEFWRALRARDQAAALRELDADPSMAFSAIAVESFCYGGSRLDTEEGDYDSVWLPAFNAAVQCECFDLALGLLERGAPSDFTDVATERLFNGFAQALAEESVNTGWRVVSSKSRIEQFFMEALGRLPAAYAARPHWLVPVIAERQQRHPALGAGPSGDDDQRVAREMPAMIRFHEALSSGRFGALPVPSWAGLALARWAFAAERPIWEARPEANAIRAASVEGIFAASIAAGGEPFAELRLGGFVAAPEGIREALQRCSMQDTRFALGMLPALERLGALEALAGWGAEKRNSLFERIKGRRGPELVDGLSAALEARELRSHLTGTASRGPGKARI